MFVRASRKPTKKELDALHTQKTDERISRVEARATEQVDKFKTDYSTKLQFDYALDKKGSQEPFLVSAIYHDDSFTYIRRRP